MSAPNILVWNSDREIPSPCSPECDPLYLSTRSNASSAISRIVLASFSSFIFSTGRTCRQPTDAWAYQVAGVPCLLKTSVSPAVKSARSGSSTAQSSTNDTGLPSVFIDIMIFSPAFLTSPMRACMPVSIASTTPPQCGPAPSQLNPRSPMRSCNSDSCLRFSSCESNANSTSRMAAGLPRTNSSTDD